MATVDPNRMRILASGDSLKLNTGYGRLSRQILSQFASQGADVLQIAWGRQEPPERVPIADAEGKNIGNIAIVPPHTADQFATETLKNYIVGWKPHMLYMSNDYMVSEILYQRAIINSEFQLPFWSQYGIIDGPYCASLGYKDIIASCDCPIVPSKYGLEQIKPINPNVMYIPHGVDRKVFYPLPEQERERIRESLGMGGKFVFGAVNRNIWRKQFPILLFSYANLKHVHKLKDIALFINADPRDNFGNDIFRWAKVLNLTISNEPDKPADIMLHRGNVNFIITIDDNELARVYNSFHCLVSASMSEGFGLPTLEAQACGVPAIICDNTANTELVKGHGWLYPTAKNADGSPVLVPPTIAQVTYFYEMPDQAALEYSMLEAYNKDELRASYGRKSYEFAKDFDWDVILPMWNEVLERAKGNGYVDARRIRAEEQGRTGEDVTRPVAAE
jgi:glycosyltransferase involved in cell wall biosynthesis